MKKPLLLILLFTAVIASASAQKLIIRTYLEKTHMSPKTGTSIGFENQFEWEYGVFFQEASLMESLMMSEAALEDLPRQYEREFAGLYFAVPIISRAAYIVKMNVRTGLTNRENFAITPSILADYRLANHIRLGMGVGSRNFRPTIQGSLAFSF